LDFNEEDLVKIADFFSKAITVAIDHDLRGKDAVTAELAYQKKRFEEMSQKEQEFFDRERLSNPYADSRILAGDPEIEIHSVMVGIDIDVAELLLAQTLKTRGVPIDLVVSHHPSGPALANLALVMPMQADILHRAGVPINIAEDLMDGRIKEVERRLMPVNHNRVLDAARLLNLPLCCLHTPADNMVASYLQKLFVEKEPALLDDVIELLLMIPEYRDAAKIGVGPRILVGDRRRKAGKIVVDMTGGTEGAKEIYENLAHGGISTIVGMHISEEHRKEAEKNHINVVIAGHIASDTLGMNLLLDEVIRTERLTVLECSGFRRFPR
jgi:putative NIF3 family GTP cyclohydrolase 1 type 2